MRRRRFLGLAAGAALAAPLSTAQAQQSASAVIGYLSFSDAAANPDWIAGFRKGLATEGFTDGRNVTIVFRSAGGSAERLAEMAASLVQQRVSIIAASQTPAAVAAKRATHVIPIVFTVASDPVQLGLVAGFNRVGGNATGLYFQAAELVPKRLALLQELVPRIKRVAVLVNADNPAGARASQQDATAAAHALGLSIQTHEAKTTDEIEAAFLAMKASGVDSLLVPADGYFASQRKLLAALCMRHSLPASFALRVHAEDGGLMSYGPDVGDSYRQAGSYVGRILKGARPADLPVMQPMRFELVINQRAAKAMRLEVSPMLLMRADEVIE